MFLDYRDPVFGEKRKDEFARLFQTIVDVGPDRDPALFWATVGGMGLTGIILDATVRLLPIETSRCVVDTERIPDLDALIERMTATDQEYRYSVAWIDLVATGASLGRSVLTSGDHATYAELLEGQPRAARSGGRPRGRPRRRDGWP